MPDNVKQDQKKFVTKVAMQAAEAKAMQKKYNAYFASKLNIIPEADEESETPAKLTKVEELKEQREGISNLVDIALGIVAFARDEYEQSAALKAAKKVIKIQNIIHYAESQIEGPDYARQGGRYQDIINNGKIEAKYLLAPFLHDDIQRSLNTCLPYEVDWNSFSSATGFKEGQEKNRASVLDVFKEIDFLNSGYATEFDSCMEKNNKVAALVNDVIMELEISKHKFEDAAKQCAIESTMSQARKNAYRYEVMIKEACIPKMEYDVFNSADKHAIISTIEADAILSTKTHGASFIQESRDNLVVAIQSLKQYQHFLDIERKVISITQDDIALEIMKNVNMHKADEQVGHSRVRSSSLEEATIIEAPKSKVPSPIGHKGFSH
jgi:hypothetical protein